MYMSDPPGHTTELPNIHLGSQHGATLDSVLQELLPALSRLDACLEAAMNQAQERFDDKNAHNPYRGLYVEKAELAELLDRKPGDPLFHPPIAEQSGYTDKSWLAQHSRLGWLVAAYELTLFEIDILLLALAPELDRRYEPIYAFLQDHVARRWPTVDLALHLFCTDALDRLERRIHFSSSAPLVRHGLISVIPEQDVTARSLLSATIKIDPQIVEYLLGQDTLDTRLSNCCKIFSPSEHRSKFAYISKSQHHALSTVVEQAWIDEKPITVYLKGDLGVGRRALIESIAGQIHASTLAVDLRSITNNLDELTACINLAMRHAKFYDCMLYFEHADTLFAEANPQAHKYLMTRLAQHDGIVFLAGSRPWQSIAHVPLGVTTITFNRPTTDECMNVWAEQLAYGGNYLSSNDLTILASRFRLTPTQIQESVALAQSLAYQRNPQEPALALTDLFEAARAQCGHELATLAQKISPTYSWEDIVLPDDALSQLREICQRVAMQHQVLDSWGFDRKLSMGKGINVLFAGPSGAGKSMTAEIIATGLGLDLYKIELSGVVSKYIGETEKNLDKIFIAATNANAILFFDEADALFGKRSEVSDSHDRYANIEISYLLQKMEAYDGIAILATNLRQNLDDAFTRRMAFAIHFPFPDQESRRQIWAGIWPSETPLADDVDLDWLAERFKLSGGNIKNVALAAAFLAATDNSDVTMKHLQAAIRREYQKMGKVLSETEFECVD